MLSPSERNRQDYERRRQRPQEVVKMQTRKLLRREVAAGRIVRQPCEVCSQPDAEAHHDDYTKPFDVRWLCQEHHRQVHAFQPHFGPYGPRKGSRAYLLQQLAIGDGLILKGNAKSIENECCRTGKRIGWRFTARSVTGGVFIQRIS